MQIVEAMILMQNKRDKGRRKKRKREKLRKRRKKKRVAGLIRLSLR